MKKNLFFSFMLLASGPLLASDAASESGAQVFRCPRMRSDLTRNVWLSFDKKTGKIGGLCCDSSGKLAKVPGVIYDGDLVLNKDGEFSKYFADGPATFNVVYSPAPSDEVTKEQSHEYEKQALAAITRSIEGN